MPILNTELKLQKSQTISDSASNGGRMSAAEITSGAMSDIFPAVGEIERAAGSIKYRKVFAKVANDADLTLNFPKIYLDKYTAGDDMVRFFAGTQTDVQSGIAGTEKKYGGGKLNANVIAGATTIDVLVEDGAANFLLDTDKIRITDKADIDDLTGNEEYVTIAGAPSVAGDVVTITVTPALANGYSASDTRVMNVYEPPDVVSSVASVVVTSAAGTFNSANLLGDNIGSIEQNWTLTFTNATTFNIVGDTVGAQGSGNIGSGASANNADFSKPFFVMQSAGFGGSFLAGDTITFTTHPAAVPIWLRRDVPAGAANLTTNEAVIVLDGETSGV